MFYCKLEIHPCTTDDSTQLSVCPIAFYFIRVHFVSSTSFWLWTPSVCCCNIYFSQLQYQDRHNNASVLHAALHYMSFPRRIHQNYTYACATSPSIAPCVRCTDCHKYLFGFGFFRITHLALPSWFESRFSVNCLLSCISSWQDTNIEIIGVLYLLIMYLKRSSK